MNKAALLPQSKESEMMVLGCMLSSTDGLNIGADSLDVTDFFYPEHRLVFAVLKQSYVQNRPADAHLVSEELRRQNKLDEVGGIPYVVSLVQFAGTSAYLEEYVEVVKAKAILRSMIDAARQVDRRAREEPKEVLDALDEAQSLFFKISQSANPETGTTIKDLLGGALDPDRASFIQKVQARQERYRTLGSEDSKVTGIPTHFMDFDSVINGLGDSNLIIIAGRPAMGKTAFALNVAQNVCFKNQLPVGIFSLEMTAEQLIDRIVSAEATVEAEKIRTGALSGEEFQRIVAAVGEMQKHTFIIDDQPGLKITDLRARARRMKERYGIRLLVIDYLQLIGGSGSTKTFENRQNEVSEISRMLKTLARELNIPILCLAQLSRKVEDRAGHRPMMSDLRESGSIEQDSDVIAFLLRRDYYDPNDKPGMAEVIIAKNRHGRIGNVQLNFAKDYGLFRNYTPIQVSLPEDSFATL